MCPAPFQVLLDAAPDAMIIIDQNGRIEHVNAQAEVLFGYDRHELLTSPVERVIPERFRGSHPGHRSRYFGAPRARAMGTSGVALYALKKDGTEFPAEVSLSPIEIDGRPLVIAAIRDGTTRQKEEEKLRRLLEAAPDAMVVSDAAGRIVFVNARAEALFGYPRTELLGLAVEYLIPERYRLAHPRHRRNYFDEPRSRPMGSTGVALFGRRKDGTEFPAEISLSPFESEDGPVAITAIRDVTDRQRAEVERTNLEKAKEAIRMRDDFLSIASHELKTPLTALNLQIDSLLRRPATSADPTKLHIIHASLVHLNALIDQLLDVSRVTSKRLELRKKEVDLATLIRRVALQFEDELSRAGCALRLDLAAGAHVSCDSLRIEQVLTNLISNALKYGAGAAIEVSLALTASTADIAVRDHGIGIAPEHQARIFERFERVVSERNYGGFGLGLWIVRQILEAHGGAIRVSSQPGIGSVFTASVPFERPRSTPGARDIDVLVVDDDALIRASIVSALTDEGLAVEGATHGGDALDRLRNGVRPRLILLDLMMPVMDGAAFRAEQVADPAFRSIPVVVISASDRIESEAKAMGVSGHFRKPIGLNDLIRVVQTYRAAVESV